MPTYQYKCDACEHEFEELQSMKEAALVTCPKCGKETLRRLISGGGSMIFKGSGFYLTDYKSKGSSEKKSDAPAKPATTTPSTPTPPTTPVKP